MTIEQLNERLAGRPIVSIVQDGEQHTTDIYVYDHATADPANGKWCYVHKQEGRTELVSKSLLEELAVRGIAVLHGSNVAEIDAQRRAGVYPLPEYVTRSINYVLTR